MGKLVEKVIAIVLAAGQGTRFSSSIPKQYSQVSGDTLTEKVISVLLGVPEVTKVLLVINEKHHGYVSTKIVPSSKDKKVIVVTGGDSRGESIFRALSYVYSSLAVTSESKILVQDSCRPFTSISHISNLLNCKDERDAWITYQVPADAQAIRISNGQIENVPEGNEIVSLQTPILLSEKIAARIISEEERRFTKGLGGYLIDIDCEIGFVESDGSTRKITWATDL